eukprot:COSAG02_NODE_68316_length_251_cov_0.500000_1_plen_57_part_10
MRRTVVCSINQPSSDIYSLVDKLLLIGTDSNNVFFNDTATTEIYTIAYTLSLHDALP